jgi:hypothetical protein
MTRLWVYDVYNPVRPQTILQVATAVVFRGIAGAPRQSQGAVWCRRHPTDRRLGSNLHLVKRRKG